MSAGDLKKLLPQIVDISIEAGKRIVEVYKTDFEVKYKEDESPVTKADMLSHEYIIGSLEKLNLALPILSEESNHIPFSERRTWESYWLIDPLDGTREFINRRDDFTVNIALIHKQKSVLGVVHIPMTQESYVATAAGGAYKYSADGSIQKLQARQETAAEVIVAVSYSHTGEKTKEFLARIGPHSLKRRGSMVKCCMIAAGEADIYPRLGNTCEWDTAAGQCMLEEAGGYLVDWQGNSFRYNTKDSIINPPFIAYAPSVGALVASQIKGADL